MAFGVGAEDEFIITQDGDTTGTNAGSSSTVVLLPTGSGFYEAGQAGQKLQTYNVTNASAYYFRMSSAETQRLNSYFKRFGKSLGVRSPKSMWSGFVSSAANSGMTPWQIMEQYDQQRGSKPGAQQQGAAGPGGSGPGGGGGSGGGPYRNTSVQISDPVSARGLVDQALQTYLGRDAKPKERALFYKTLTASQAAAPYVDTGVSSAGGSSSVRTGGTSPEELAKEFAQSRKGYSEYQGATTYLDAFIKNLSNPTAVI